MMHLTRIKRIVDVNLNRACEGIRVMEDIARFVCNSPELSKRLKKERHELRNLFVAEIAGSTRSRDIASDTGRSPSIIEEDRKNIAGLATRNAKRVEEALRSLEEMNKLLRGKHVRALKRMRFTIYGLEQDLQEILSKGKGLKGVGIYVVLPDETERKIMRLVRKLADAPVAAIQLRSKHLSDARLLALAKRVRSVTRKRSIQMIVNDRVDIALASGADGVHIGQDDMDLEDVRRITDFSFTIGVSTHSIEEAMRAESEGADYIAFGSIFPTRSKEHAVIQGIPKLKRLVKRITIPVVAIGGISEKNVTEIASSGARFAAVLSYLADAADPSKAAKRLHSEFRRGMREQSDRG